MWWVGAYFTSRANLSCARVTLYSQLPILASIPASTCAWSSLGADDEAHTAALSAPNCSATVARSSSKTVPISSSTISHWKSSSARSFQTILAFQSVAARFLVL
jgi:hypothetical protein